MNRSIGITLIVLAHFCLLRTAESETFTVTNTNDTGAGSFRQAIEAANANAGVLDTIDFNIPPSDPNHVYHTDNTIPDFPGNLAATTEADDANLDNPDPDYPYSFYKISIESPLPPIVDPVMIDAYTQGAETPSPAMVNSAAINEPMNSRLRLELFADGAGFRQSGFRLDPGSDGSTIRGFAITGAQGNTRTQGEAILVNSDNNTIEGNIIGPSVDAVTISFVNNIGIRVMGSGNTIGGTVAEARNLVSGNRKMGVLILGGSGENIVQGNVIGLDRSGQRTMGNEQEGVVVSDSPINLIGGTGSGARNVISDNRFHGVLLFGPLSTGNIVRGNYIGTDITGTQDLGNMFMGVIALTEASGNTIGGTEPGAANVISGNGQAGIILDDQSNNNLIEGNYLGTDETGALALGNGFSGVLILNSSNNTIGGAPDAGNTIAFNDTDGITVSDMGAKGPAPLSVGNRIQANSIYANTRLGIDLSPILGAFATGDGETANDLGDPDTGSNNLQNSPALVSAELGATLDITYSVDSTSPNSAFPLTIEFFVADTVGDEGRTFLGSNTYSETDGQKVAMLFPSAPVGAGDRILATATDAGGNTSEFSPSIGIGGGSFPNVVVVNSTGNACDLDPNDGVCDTGSDVGAEPECTLCAAIAHANSIPNVGASAPDEIRFAIPSDDPGHVFYIDNSVDGSINPDRTMETTVIMDGDEPLIDSDWPNSWWRIEPDAPLPTITDPVVIDGYSQNFGAIGAVENTNPVGQGFNSILRIEINGANAGEADSGILQISAGGSAIKGLVINRVDGHVVQIDTVGGNRIEGCYLGTDISGSKAYPLPVGGLRDIARPAAYLLSDNNTVGGENAAARNLLSGNLEWGGAGVEIGEFGAGANGNVVQGNLIGTDRSGIGWLPNFVGVAVSEGAGNTIGGIASGMSNLIADKVQLFGSENSLARNRIGPDINGMEIAGIVAGVTVAGSDNTLEQNEIAFGSGITILSGEGNLLTQNSVYETVGLGIDLVNDLGQNRVNLPQDDGDVDSGPNNLQNFPTFTRVFPSKGEATLVEGVLKSAPDTNYRLEFFANRDRGTSGFGEGEFFLRDMLVSTHEDGVENFVAHLPAPPSGFDFITATATDITDTGSGPANDTSEFSGAFPLTGCSLTVTTTADSGPGSLREAIHCANLNGGLESIDFAIPGAGPHTIQLETPLPNILDPVVIDGYTQGQNTPGDTSDDATPNTNPVGQGLNMDIRIELNGTGLIVDKGLGLLQGADGLHILTSGAGSTIRGLALNGFQGQGIFIEGGGTNRVEGNIIGLDVDGETVGSNLGNGVLIIDSQENVVGGLTPQARNLISSNDNGVFITGVPSMRNLVQGNLIGTDITGTQGIGHEDDGIDVCFGPSQNTIGGSEPGSRNVIAWNGDDGVDLNDSNNNTVQGNFIGVDVTGEAALGSGQTESDGDCVCILDGAGNLVAQNVLGGGEGSASDGVQITGATSTENVIQGNFIGTDLTAEIDLGNDCEGIFIGFEASDNLVGGPGPGQGNAIAFNKTNVGVHVAGDGVGNSILANSIFSNATLGIELDSEPGSFFDGVTPNDSAPDSDTGGNNLQNFPILDSIAAKGTSGSVMGSLASVPNTQFRIEFFANKSCDDSGNGEGARFVGSVDVTTDAQGNASFNASLSAQVYTGESLTSTATLIEGPSDFGDTSEFSECLPITVDTGPTPIPTGMPPAECPNFDFDGSLFVDAEDLLTLFAGLQTTDLLFDISGNGVVDDEDLLLISACWHLMVN